MRYILILAVTVLLVRIDFILGLFDRVTDSFEPSPPQIETKDIKSNLEVISVSDDKSLMQRPEQTFLLLLEDFRLNPQMSVRERALEVLRKNPKMFSIKLDKDLEAHIFRWRELLVNNEPEVVNFLLELMKMLEGENLEMVKRFFSLWMVIDMENFIKAYSRTRDSNCMIVTTFGENIPEEEKLNEYYERQDALKVFVAKEKIDPVHKTLANNCLLVLGMEIDRLSPRELLPEPAPTISPEAVSP